MRATPSRRVAGLYLRGHRPRYARPPRSYCHPTQPKYTKNEPKSKLLLVFLAFVHIFLYLCAVLYIFRFVMTKKILFPSVLAIIAIVMTSCFLNPEPEVVFEEANLLGLWGRDKIAGQDSVPVKFVRFTGEIDESGEYKYGRQWDESEDIYEEDLKPYGNGWFKYKLVKNNLTEIHLMDNGGADIPKVYIVQKLTEYELKYKDDFGKTHHYYKCEVICK